MRDDEQKILSALLGQGRRYNELYMHSASFHAVIPVIAQVLPAVLETFAADREQEPKILSQTTRLLTPERGGTFQRHAHYAATGRPGRDAGVRRPPPG